MAITPANTLRLNILGGASLVADGRPLQRVLAQRRRLALLCMAALESKRGISRSKAAALLWPDADDERARHALSQLIYLLRTELRSEELFGDADSLRLSERVVTADCVEFEAALDRGDLAAAVALYSGDLLDGIVLGDSVGMERWVEGHRDRLKSRAVDALCTLASDAAAHSAWKESSAYWRRASELQPADTLIALNAMEALTKDSQKESAIALGRAHEKYLREELEIPVPESLTAKLEAVGRTTPVKPVPISTQSPAIEPGSENLAAAGSAVSGASRIPEVPQTPWRSYWRAAGIGAILVVAVAAAIGMKARRSTSPAGPAERRIVILPFEIRGTDSLGYLRQGMVDLMASDIDVGGYSAVNPALTISTESQYSGSVAGPELARAVATATGAELFISGEVVSVGSKVRVSAGLFDRETPGMPVATAVEESDRQGLFGLVDRLTLQLIAQRIGTTARRFESEALAHGTPLAALRLYLGGESEFRRGNYAAAMSDYREAVDVDSTFALAYFRLCIAAEWQGAPYSIRQDAVTKALRYLSSLSPREQLMLRALDLQMHGEIELADSMYRSILDRYADDAAARMQLAELEFHYNQLRGRSFADSKPQFENVYALSGDPSALLHLARIAAWEGKSETAESLFVRYYVLRSGDADPETALFRAVVTKRNVVRDSVLNAIARASKDTILGCAWRLAQYTGDFQSADRTLALLTRPSRRISDRRIGYQLRAYVRAMAGDWKNAAALLDSLRPIDPLRSAMMAGVLGAIPGLPVPPGDLEAVRSTLADAAHRGNQPDTRDEVFNFGGFTLRQELARIEGLLSYKVRDSATLGQVAEEFQRSVKGSTPQDSDATTMATELSAMVLHLAGRDAEGLKLLTTLENPSRGIRAEFPPHLRYLFGEVAAAAGDRAEANRWLSSFDGGFWGDLLYARPANQAKATAVAMH